MKRAVRLKSPLFYSSHTIHLINQRETTFKQLGSDNSFLLALKLRKLNLSISDSIELDKELLINQFDLSSTRQCYKLLRSFGFNSPFPPVLFNGNEPFFTDSEKALGFNKFFASIFQDKSSYTVPDQLKEPSKKLMHMNFFYLMFSSSWSCVIILVPLVPMSYPHSSFTNVRRICVRQFLSFSSGLSKPNIGMIFGKEHMLLPLHKSGPPTVPLVSFLNFPCSLKDYCSIAFTRRYGIKSNVNNLDL